MEHKFKVGDIVKCVQDSNKLYGKELEVLYTPDDSGWGYYCREVGGDNEDIYKEGFLERIELVGSRGVPMSAVPDVPVEPWGAVPMLMDQLMCDLLPKDNPFITTWNAFRDELGWGGDHIWIEMAKAGNALEIAMNKHLDNEFCESYNCGVIAYDFQTHLTDHFFDSDLDIEADDILQYWSTLVSNAETVVREWKEEVLTVKDPDPEPEPEPIEVGKAGSMYTLNELPNDFPVEFEGREALTTDQFSEVDGKGTRCLRIPREFGKDNYRWLYGLTEVKILEDVPDDYDPLAELLQGDAMVIEMTIEGLAKEIIGLNNKLDKLIKESK